MAKMSKKRCSMCGKKLTDGNIVTDGENNFCDVGCKKWFRSTYLDEGVKPIE